MCIYYTVTRIMFKCRAYVSVCDSYSGMKCEWRLVLCLDVPQATGPQFRLRRCPLLDRVRPCWSCRLTQKACRTFSCSPGLPQPKQMANFCTMSSTGGWVKKQEADLHFSTATYQPPIMTKSCCPTQPMSTR